MMPTHLNDADLKRETLVEWIEQGVPQGQFGYAKGIAEDTSTYANLFFREALPPDVVNFEGFLIDPQTAAAGKNTARGSMRSICPLATRRHWH